jgi:hypothetical protein
MKQTWEQWQALMIRRCPWHPESMAATAWSDMNEWKEYYNRGLSTLQAIRERFELCQ